MRPSFRLHVAGRCQAIAVKEFLQIRRDRLTFAMILGIPILQLLLFGYAINTDPRQLPTAIVLYDHSPLARAIVSGILQTQYFAATRPDATLREAEALLATGQVQFVISVPEDFTRDLVRGRSPSLLVEADASDPAATSSALASLDRALSETLARELTGILSPLRQSAKAADVIIHRRYNPEGVSQHHIVPGLLGVILTMTMVLMTALAVTRERERGTLENLLATPASPLEVIAGKMLPYILIGLLQVTLILVAAKWLFQVPMLGRYVHLYGAVSLFIASNLSLGLAFSVLARNQLQAMQMTFFYFLPSILLSGFMFPFRGMPVWAQWIGELLPLTHFLRLARSIMLKGLPIQTMSDDVLAILGFSLAAFGVALLRYKRTLD